MTLSPLSPAFKEAHNDAYGAEEEKNVHVLGSFETAHIGQLKRGFNA
jgi:hypothetical protein